MATSSTYNVSGVGYKDRMRKRMAEKSEGIFWKPEQGQNTIHILPSRVQLKMYAGLRKKSKKPVPWSKVSETLGCFATYPKHRQVGPNKRSVMCQYGEASECTSGFLCKKARALSEKGKATASKNLLPEDCVAFLVSVHNKVDDTFGPPKIWEMRITNTGIGSQVLTLALRRALEDPQKGRCLNFTRTGTGLATKYGPIDMDDAGTAIPIDVLREIKDWAECLRFVDDATAKKIYFGREDDEDEADAVDVEEADAVDVEEEEADDEEEEEAEEEEEEEADDEDDEEEEEAEEEEEEEEEADDEEEDLFADDDEEEDEPPKKKVAKKKVAKKATKKVVKKKKKRRVAAEDSDVPF